MKRWVVFLALWACTSVAACGPRDECHDPDGYAYYGGGCGWGDDYYGDYGAYYGGVTGGFGGDDSGPDGAIPGAVHHYGYYLDASVPEALTKLLIKVQPPGGDCFDLDCVPVPSKVTWDGPSTSDYTVDDGVLHACGESIYVTNNFQLNAVTSYEVGTSLGLDVGFSIKKDMDGGDFSYLLSWMGGCDWMGPCDDDPAALVTYLYDITHPAGSTVLCPGVLTPGETHTSCEIQKVFAPTYSAVMWAADPLWVRTPFMTANDVEWVFYEVPSGDLAGCLDKTVMAEFFGWITGLLGPYPYGKELRFAGAPTTWLGFEHPANILLQEKLSTLVTDYLDTTTHVVMHEVVHQWAGNRVTIKEAADYVWKEAIAEYLTYVFEEEHIAPGIAAATRGYWDEIALQALHYPRPVDDPMPQLLEFYEDVYGSGPMVLFVQLEALIGRAAVLEGIQSFLTMPAARSVGTLRLALSTAAGVSLTPYFDAWVFGKGAPEWPTFVIETAQDAASGEVTVTVTQENASGKLYGCVVEVDVQGATQTVTAMVDFGLDPKSATASATATLAEPVVTAVLDPRHKLVARDKAEPSAPKVHPVWIF